MTIKRTFRINYQTLYGKTDCDTCEKPYSTCAMSPCCWTCTELEQATHREVRVMPRLKDFPKSQGLSKNDLSSRELEVVRLLADGKTTVEVAKELHLVMETVKTHIAHISRKLGCANRTEIVAVCLRQGLIA